LAAGSNSAFTSAILSKLADVVLTGERLTFEGVDI
jgi:hypothetical protein